MSDAATVTGGDLSRMLGDLAALPGVDAAVKAQADELAASISGEGITTRVLQRGAGTYTVEVSGEGLFEREFGSQSQAAEAPIAAALAEATT